VTLSRQSLASDKHKPICRPYLFYILIVKWNS